MKGAKAMMNSKDRQAIEGLFDRIEDVARNSAPRDRDAEQLIQQRLGDYPPAPYYMAQTILIQEEALRQAQQRIEELERQGSRGGGFLGGLLGDANDRPAGGRQRGPWDRTPDYGRDRMGGAGGGGFLAGAAQTALGVTGGVLLGSAIAGMLTGGAQAEEFQPADQADADAPSNDAGAEDLGGEDMGGSDFGGDDLDLGGEF
jgi:hypothetical protein